ncbi:hypothetical protein TIFTF001_023235 [Ficus carica]|uniref:Uncharacterized protein n=1 Tax=Ficus carica TaxID=3494 RepID=A0AA88DK53_FICCA|nr:hypothetical protein TIFTF001_023235 [Ficus carica]
MNTPLMDRNPSTFGLNLGRWFLLLPSQSLTLIRSFESTRFLLLQQRKLLITPANLRESGLLVTLPPPSRQIIPPASAMIFTFPGEEKEGRKKKKTVESSSQGADPRGKGFVEGSQKDARSKGSMRCLSNEEAVVEEPQQAYYCQEVGAAVEDHLRVPPAPSVSLMLLGSRILYPNFIIPHIPEPLELSIINYMETITLAQRDVEAESITKDLQDEDQVKQLEKGIESQKDEIHREAAASAIEAYLASAEFSRRRGEIVQEFLATEEFEFRVQEAVCLQKVQERAAGFDEGHRRPNHGQDPQEEKIHVQT